MINVRLLATLALSLAFLLIACRGGGNDELEIAETFEGYFAALGRDTAEAYAYLARECTEQVDFSEFALQTELATFFAANEIEVRNVDILERHDDKLVVDLDVHLVTEGEEAEPSEPWIAGLGRATVVKEGGRWRLADCENFAPPDDAGAGVTTAPATPVSRSAAPRRSLSRHLPMENASNTSRRSIVSSL
jgi:hypothetical protein